MAFTLKVDWESDNRPIADGDFCRDHRIHFGSGQIIQASSAPEYKGCDTKINPEEQLLGALSSCHMLTFLTIAHLKRLKVLSYKDTATAELGKNEMGKIAITKIILKPVVIFDNGLEVNLEVLAKIHEKAHANCFIANSLSAEIEVLY
ncbi:putative redox protein, regulator of disulfide bond formation [Shewanella psychrophila]|uniref:Putative redox protein, regulator of disulfide bond formation n=1 Tax=Shewanella psychrophila TaxID=225848 RepID=A0A1S6HUD3_9GAMM|nr:OsmC family protein [Shewanella psychrophila]AQS39163.1 putative redox protein, regulator of disulfide bond formation [Shewanella psychrophila]